MKRFDWLPCAGVMLGLAAGSCGGNRGGDDNSGSASGIGSGIDSADGTASDDAGNESNDSGILDVGVGQTGECGGGDIGCTDQIDLLFVIDNSGSMGEEQENLARNFPLLIRKLENLTDSNGVSVNPDVQIMVTTSDYGNPLCSAFEHPDYDPAKGAPISTACTTRLGRFTGLTDPPVVAEQACTNVCSNDAAAPEGDPFIAFSPGGDNIPASVTPADIDGDGLEDSPVAQALACIGPQGIDGCGYESQLEGMLQALNPSATWNEGARPFLRERALLAIVLITDEVDCSVEDYTIMSDESFMEPKPGGSDKEASSAICWNAGVTCNGPDSNGVYTDCTSASNGKLQPTSRYTEYLIDNLRGSKKKEVVMLGILGVPEVTAHNPEPPFEPIAGGVADLVYRDWRDGEYPGVGDILPGEYAAGVRAADKQFDFGIGPGCTGGDAVSGFAGQALPPVRVKEVCEALNIDNDDGSVDVRCCIESICDDDFSAAINCLTGIIQESIVAPG